MNHEHDGTSTCPCEPCYVRLAASFAPAGKGLSSSEARRLVVIAWKRRIDALSVEEVQERRPWFLFENKTPIPYYLDVIEYIDRRLAEAT